MDCHVNLDFGDTTETLSGEDLDRYADQVGLSALAKGRYSRVFTVELYLHERVLRVEPWTIMQEIAGFERGTPSRGTKPPSQFAHEPLRGLWHKHYFCARFSAQNMLNELTEKKVRAMIKEAHGENLTDDQMAICLARRMTVEQIQQREDAGRLTGEWIVFAKHAGRNYYLCLATHGSSDREIFERIISGCVPQFPFLSDVLRRSH